MSELLRSTSLFCKVCFPSQPRHPSCAQFLLTSPTLSTPTWTGYKDLNTCTQFTVEEQEEVFDKQCTRKTQMARRTTYIVATECSQIG